MFDVTLLPINMREKILPSEESRYNGSQCWEWLGATNSKGYGCVTNGKGKSVLSHRTAYQIIVGEIPEGMTIDHLCRNKTCLNTDHLEPVTTQENTRRHYATVTHCKKGHELSGDNVYRKKRSYGHQRVCRTCNYEYMKTYRARVKERELERLQAVTDG